MRLFITLFFLTPALAGCFGGGGDAFGPSAAGREGDVPTLPEGLEMDGAEVVSYNETSVVWRWSDTAPAGVLNLATREAPRVATTVPVPENRTLLMGVDLSWQEAEAPSALVLEARDEDGRLKCLLSRNQDGYGLSGMSSSMARPCKVLVETQPSATEWEVAVMPFGNADTEQSFTVKVSLSAIVADKPLMVAHHADGIPLEDLTALAPLEAYDVGHEAYEPTLGLDDEGTVFFQGAWRGTAPTVVRSDDQGASWQDVSPRTGDVRTNAFTADPYLNVDADTGRVFTLDYVLPTVECQQLAFTDDKGETWTTVPVCGHTDYQKIFTGPPATSPTVGYPHIVYVCSINAGIATTSLTNTCSKSLDGGMTFITTGSPPFVGGPVPENPVIPADCAGGMPPPAVDADGTIFAVKHRCGQTIALAVSRDEGLTWQESEGPGHSLEKPAIAVDGEGTVYVAWLTDDRLPMLSYSLDQGRGWTEPVMVGPPGLVTASLIDVAARQDGHVALSYMGTMDASSGGPDDNSTWTGYITVAPNAITDDPVFYTTAVTPETDPLVEGDCPQVRCPGAFDFLDVDFGTDGAAWAAFVDNAGRTNLDRGIGLVARLPPVQGDA